MLDCTRSAWDLIPLMEAWLAYLKAIEFETMTKPTPFAGWTLRWMTVNVHHPITLLPAAWSSGRFDWNPKEDAEAIEVTLQRDDDVRAYASSACDGWTVFLSEHGDRLQENDRVISSSRGDMTFSDLLSYMRFHSAFRYRQLQEFLAAEHVTLPNAFSICALRDLKLPSAVS